MKPLRRKVQYGFDYEKLEALPISIRQYVKGLRNYETELTKLRALITGLPLFSPIEKWCIEIDDHIVARIKEISQNELESRNRTDISELMLEVAQSLEEILNRRPSVDFPCAESADQEKIFDDIYSLFDNIVDFIQEAGYELYNYLSGAEF